MMGIKNIETYLSKPVSIIPLAIFRIAFGFLLCFSQLRFIAKGWIDDCYVNPSFHFTYQYFNWVQPFSSESMYLIVALCAISAFCIGLGLFYRFSTIFFFISFTYLELIEKSWYLNHYYFVSLVAFLLIWLPANNKYAVDPILFKKARRADTVPQWTIDILKFQLVIVYFFGGIAKLKPDWLLHAQPLKIWLKARTDFPIIGSLFDSDITPFLFSWSGTLYDLSIPFLLWNKRTRPIAYILVVLFHILTYMLFNIGMFPWLMMAGSLIFITSTEWKALLQKINIYIKDTPILKANKRTIVPTPFLLLFCFIQITIPLRHFFLSDNVLWTENGIRFAWHVMVMEKNGFTEFKILDLDTKKQFTVYPSLLLTPIQEKQMSFQPDMIWQFAQFLEKKYNPDGSKDLAIYVNSKVSLNGRPSQTYIDSNINLLSLKTVDNIYSHIRSMVN